MRHFTTSELNRMRSTQEGAMMDTCIVQAYSDGASDGLGHPAPTYTPGSAQICGYKPGATREAHDDGEVVQIDAVLRLMHDATITGSDRVQLTKRYGETLTTPLLFAVVGQPALGPSGLVVNLRRVTDA